MPQRLQAIFLARQLALVLLCVVAAGAQESVAEDRPANETFREQLSDAKAVVRQGLSAIGKPVPENPFEVGTQEHSIHVMRFEKAHLERMDSAVKDMIWQGFKRGMALEAIMDMTRGEITWSEWPTSFTDRDLASIRGVQDDWMTDQEWLDEDNAVVILYRKYSPASGPAVCVMQNSFRSTSKNLARECPSTYVVIVSPDSESQIGYLPCREFVSPGGMSTPGFIPYLLGFMPEPGQSVPGILLIWGGGGVSVGIAHYRWNDTYRLWEGVFMPRDESQVRDPFAYSYNGDELRITLYHCYEHQDSGPDQLGCPRTLDLREYLSANSEQIEATRRKNARIGGMLTPPREMYVEKPAPPDETKE